MRAPGIPEPQAPEAVRGLLVSDEAKAIALTDEETVGVPLFPSDVQRLNAKDAGGSRLRRCASSCSLSIPGPVTARRKQPSLGASGARLCAAILMRPHLRSCEMVSSPLAVR